MQLRTPLFINWKITILNFSLGKKGETEEKVASFQVVHDGNRSLRIYINEFHEPETIRNCTLVSALYLRVESYYSVWGMDCYQVNPRKREEQRQIDNLL